MKLKKLMILGQHYFFPHISEISTYRGLPSAVPENLPNAHKMADSVICLPMHYLLSENAIERTLAFFKK
jgi:dTDP-4-amino-4,6-dideoxygalactose transaminase